MTQTPRIAALAVLLVGLASPAHADFFVSGTITGTVTDASGVTNVSPGDVLTGSYTYDANSTVDEYGLTVNPLTAFSLSVGTVTLDLADVEGTTAVPAVPGRDLGTSTPTDDSLFFILGESAFPKLFGSPGGLSSITLTSGAAETYKAVSDGGDSISFTFLATPAPEPSTVVLSASTLACFAVFGWLKGRRRARIATS